MSIKVIKLKSDQDIIADVSEVQHKDTKLRQAFVFDKPYLILSLIHI